MEANENKDGTYGIKGKNRRAKLTPKKINHPEAALGSENNADIINSIPVDVIPAFLEEERGGQSTNFFVPSEASAENLINDCQSYYQPMNKIQCHICGRLFDDSDLLQLHHSRVHAINNLCVCSYCNLMFISPNQLQTHMQTIHGTFQPAQGACFYITIDNRNSQNLAHTSNDSFSNLFNNNTVSMDSGDETAGKINESIELPGSTETENTPTHVKQSTTKGKKKRKSVKKSTACTDINAVRPHICHLCNRTFLKKANLNTHMRVHFPKQRSCTVCGQVFESKVILRNHMLVHANYQVFTCQVCNHVFTRVQDLTRHKDIHENNYTCNICGKVFFKLFQFKRHQNQHDQEKEKNISESTVSVDVSPNQTTEIPEKTATASSASTSVLTELEVNNTRSTTFKRNSENMYECKTCDKMFKTLFYLKTHIRTHTGERPYSCEICKKSFTQLSTLQTHKRRHTGEKPYKCMICGKAFSVRLYLNAHMRTHTGDKPFVCTICGRGFSQPSSLASHKKLHEKD